MLKFKTELKLGIYSILTKYKQKKRYKMIVY